MSGCPFHNASGSVPSIMELLKSSTAELHGAAEGHAFQQALVRGELPREQYAAYLGQLLRVHQELESQLKRYAPATPAIARVVKAYQYQVPYLLEDLAFFGMDPGSIEPLPATRALVEEIRAAAASDAVSLLGYQYVMEGSNNGNKFIAKAIARAYGLTDGRGLKYLDPYGDQQRSYWMAFKSDMDACGFTPAQMKSLALAAQSMFRGIGAISSAMGAAVAA